MREPALTDFTIDVSGVGSCTFGRRTGRDRFKIATEYHRLVGGLDVSGSDLGVVAEAYSTLGALLVDGPDSLQKAMDLEADDDGQGTERDNLVLKVYFALRAKELSFRPNANKASEGNGAKQGEDAGVLVQAEVQPTAE